jgi:hypothetical protein
LHSNGFSHSPSWRPFSFARLSFLSQGFSARRLASGGSQLWQMTVRGLLYWRTIRTGKAGGKGGLRCLWHVYGNGESLYSAFGSAETKSQKIADTGAWRACFQSYSHLLIPLYSMGWVSWIADLGRYVSISLALKGCS